MPQDQLSIRSTKAKTLAHSLAKAERRTVSQVVELALESYAAGRFEPSRSAVTGEGGFWSRMSREFGGEIDLRDIVRQHRHPQRDVES